ncbi:hypothetical protein PoB_002555900 [Plakobranchus ocellatus]|uniref:Uncharacterized protein n=1 Tax=Plakobranchus ocellatus TaxID=259542 RepID=A0AAV3ZYP6_9GAST|nr:hypothetical protein PoB_002555900 [Plakobranchus ocellatus]
MCGLNHLPQSYSAFCLISQLIAEAFLSIIKYLFALSDNFFPAYAKENKKEKQLWFSYVRGIKLVLTRDTRVLVEARITCGILLCEEKLPPTNTKSSFNMSVFKNQPTCSRSPEDELESRVLVASINSENPNISRVTDASKVFGVLGIRNASLRIDMFKHDDCSSDFTCEVQGLDNREIIIWPMRF